MLSVDFHSAGQNSNAGLNSNFPRNEPTLLQKYAICLSADSSFSRGSSARYTMQALRIRSAGGIQEELAKLRKARSKSGNCAGNAVNRKTMDFFVAKLMAAGASRR